MSFPKYPKYKPSGVEWLGEVPEHWSVTRLKSLCRLVTEKAEARSRAVALEHVESGTGRLIGDAGEFEGEGTAFVAGDLLFGKLRPYLAKAWVADSKGEAVGDFHVMRATRRLCERYLLYTTLNRDFIQLVDGSTYGSKMPRASWEFMGCMPLCEPSLAEQRAIAAFLDRETAKIDALIAEQENLIELLAEKRQAVISHAVTKGLNPAAPMKPSGIEWLGDVPAHWSIQKLKHAVPALTVGIVVEPSKYYVESGVPALRSLNVQPGRIKLDELVYLSSLSNDLHGKSKLRAGDIVAVRSGQPGTAAIVPEELDGCNCIDLIIIRRPADGSGPYLCWFLAADAARAQVAHGSDGAIQQHFNISTAAQLVVTSPPKRERDEIVEFLNQSVASIDDLHGKADLAVTLLRERRSALISAAVTGQIDVRNAVPEPAA